MKPKRKLPKAVQAILDDTALDEAEAWMIYRMERGEITGDVHILTEEEDAEYCRRNAAEIREFERLNQERLQKLEPCERRAFELAGSGPPRKPGQKAELTLGQEEAMQMLLAAQPHVTPERAQLVILFPELYGIPSPEKAQRLQAMADTADPERQSNP